MDDNTITISIFEMSEFRLTEIGWAIYKDICDEPFRSGSVSSTSGDMNDALAAAVGVARIHLGEKTDVNVVANDDDQYVKMLGDFELVNS